MPARKCGKCKENLTNSAEVVCTACCRNVNMVVNKLLTYANSHRSSSSTLQIKIAILNFFSPDDIAEARQIMTDNVKDVIPEFPNLGKRRTDSINRQASDIMTDDILDMFKALDNMTEEWLVPSFVCDNVCKLPGSPEAAGNLMSIYEEITKHERRLVQLQESMTKVIMDVADNHTAISELRTQTPSGSRNITAGSSGKGPAGRQARGRQRLRSMAANSVPVSDDIVAPGDAGSDTAGDTSTPAPQPYQDALVSEHAADETAGDVEFQAIGHNNGRRPNKGNGKPQKKRVTRTGGTAAEAGGLLAGPETFQVQITNVSPSLSQGDIATYVESKHHGLTASQIEDITSEGWNTKRFLLTFEFKHYDVVMAEDFWPRKIYFKRWFARKQSNNNNNG